MASTKVSTTSAAAVETPASKSNKPATSTPATAPTSLEDNYIARTFSHAHAAVVLSSYWLNFGNLVTDPFTTVAVNLGPLSLMQFLYLFLCLPLTTTTTASTSTAASSRQQKNRVGRQAGGSSGSVSDVARVQKAFAAIYSLILTFSLATPCLYLLIILLGGPLLTHTPHTLLLAAHTATLAAPALFYRHGVDGKRWINVLALQMPVDEAMGGALGSVLGAWLGAVPIPLDWDRAWQAWPVTVVTGSYLGWAVGKTFGGSVFWGRSISLE